MWRPAALDEDEDALVLALGIVPLRVARLFPFAATRTNLRCGDNVTFAFAFFFGAAAGVAEEADWVPGVALGRLFFRRFFSGPASSSGFCGVDGGGGGGGDGVATDGGAVGATPPSPFGLSRALFFSFFSFYFADPDL